MTRHHKPWPSFLLSISICCISLYSGLGSAASDTPTTATQTTDVINVNHIGEVVIQVSITDQAQLQWLLDRYDVWRRNPHTKTWPVRLPLMALPELERLGIQFVVDAEQTEQLHQSPPLTPQPSGIATIPNFPCYRSVTQTLADLSDLAQQHPDLTQLVDIGDSWRKTNGQGGNDLLALVLSNQQQTGPKPAFVIIAAIHAREYATAELATRFAEQLIDQYGVDADATWLLDEYEIHIIPQLNPDGRGIAENFSTRFKRKNDNSAFCNENDETRGVDLNRNSSVLWGGAGTSTNQCSDVYLGPEPTSEPETMAIENYLASIFSDQRPGDPNSLTTPAAADSEGLFISLHSFSELVLFPWEAVSNNSGNHIALRSLARKLAFYNQYLACQDCLGSTAGTTVDYAYGEFGVASLTFEIGTSFFQSCSSFNNQVLPDNLEALRQAAKNARRPYQTPSAPEVTIANPGVMTVFQGESAIFEAQVSDIRRRLVSDDNNEAADSAHTIQAAYYSINVPAWDGANLINMQALDGFFDTATEQVSAQLNTSTLSLGRHTIFIYGEDENGIGVPSAFFLEVVQNEQIFQNGFESNTTSP